MKRFILFVVVMFSFITSAMANLEVRTLEKEKFSIVAINDVYDNGIKLGISFVCSKVDEVVYPTFIEPSAHFSEADVEYGFRIVSWDSRDKESMVVIFDSEGGGMFSLARALKVMADIKYKGIYSIRVYMKGNQILYETEQFNTSEFNKLFKPVNGCNLSEVSERKDWRKDVDINFDSYDKMYK